MNKLVIFPISLSSYIFIRYKFYNAAKCMNVQRKKKNKHSQCCDAFEVYKSDAIQQNQGKTGWL